MKKSSFCVDLKMNKIFYSMGVPQSTSFGSIKLGIEMPELIPGVSPYRRCEGKKLGLKHFTPPALLLPGH